MSGELMNRRTSAIAFSRLKCEALEEKWRVPALSVSVHGKLAGRILIV